MQSFIYNLTIEDLSKNWKVDYTELVEALKEHNRFMSRDRLSELLPRCVTYLIITMDARREDAEDIVHDAFIKVYEKVMEGDVSYTKYFFKYLLEACRNEYYNLMRNRKYEQDRADEDLELYLVSPPEQINKLVTEERRRMLRDCVEELPEDYQGFAWYYCQLAEWNASMAASHFGTSNDLARQRKSRTMERIIKCLRRKVNKEKWHLFDMEYKEPE